MEDPDLPITMTDVGTITSIFPLFYGCSKFVSGVLSDRLSPHVMLGGALAATALTNIAFGFSSSLWMFCALVSTAVIAGQGYSEYFFQAGFNGILQGCGAPSCAKFLTAWFATKVSL